MTCLNKRLFNKRLVTSNKQEISRKCSLLLGDFSLLPSYCLFNAISTKRLFNKRYGTSNKQGIFSKVFFTFERFRLIIESQLIQCRFKQQTKSLLMQSFRLLFLWIFLVFALISFETRSKTFILMWKKVKPITLVVNKVVFSEIYLFSYYENPLLRMVTRTLIGCYS